MILFEWLIYSLAVWRVSSLITREDGPGDMFAKLRIKLGTRFDENSQEIGTSNISRGILCLWCVSLWASAPAAVVWELSHNFNLFDLILVWLALSASAIFIERVIK